MITMEKFRSAFGAQHNTGVHGSLIKVQSGTNKYIFRVQRTDHEMMELLWKGTI
jgi:hypothetical protein